MRRVGRWVGPALCVLGLVAVIVAVYAGTLWALERHAGRPLEKAAATD